ARPSQCSCDQTLVNCQNIRLASVPAGIPTDKQRLWLNNNQITKLEPGVFDSLTALLTDLGLDSNQFQALPAGVFDRLGNLQGMDLTNNQLKSVSRGHESLHQLSHLGLSDNRLKSIP
uniref:Variable lymphocyte receptor B cassette n=2 Tax=Petromyzon marinus TaxID=7757 RepID=S4RM37_PETMA